LKAVAAVVLGLLALAASQCHRSPVEPTGDVDLTGPRGRAVILEPGWSPPVKLPVSDVGWEDSPYISRDGSFILFFYHPAVDIFTDPAAALAIQRDGRIYMSKRPFATKTLYRVSTPDSTSEAGPYIYERGVLFYVRLPLSLAPRKIVRDGVQLDLGTNGPEGNPHYCDAMDELYFDNGETIFLNKSGRTTAVAAPINLPGTRSYDSFLLDDCQTLFFVSTRQGGFKVFKSLRQGALWGTPQLYIDHPDGVGEFTMTKNQREMVFLELTRLPGGSVTTDLYYARR
jgi:hypothetical protein